MSISWSFIMFQILFNRKFVIFAVFLVVLVLILIIRGNHNDLSSEDKISEARQTYIDVSRNAENLTQKQRLELLNEKVVEQFPHSDVSLDVRLETSQINYNLQKMPGLSVPQHNQLLCRIQKRFLEYHPDSTKLLLHLAKLGFRSYPKEAVLYTDRLLSIDPINVEGYLISSEAYQVLGDFKSALSALEFGKDLITNRIASELKKRYPYSSDGKLPVYYAHEVNKAKSYLRVLGYDVSNDVDYDFSKIIAKTRTSIVGSRSPYLLSNDEMTTISDLFYLDQILVSIEAIKADDPIWTPNSRVPIISDISKKSDR